MDAIPMCAGEAMAGVYDPCDQCDGHGEYPFIDDRGVERYVNCSACDGTGGVESAVRSTAKPVPLVLLGQGDYRTTIEE